MTEAQKFWQIILNVAYHRFVSLMLYEANYEFKNAILHFHFVNLRELVGEYLHSLFGEHGDNFTDGKITT